MRDRGPGVRLGEHEGKYQGRVYGNCMLRRDETDVAQRERVTNLDLKKKYVVDLSLYTKQVMITPSQHV